MGALPFVIQALSSLPSLIAAGLQVRDVIDHTRAKAQQFHDEQRDPTADEWDELNAKIDALRQQLHS